MFKGETCYRWQESHSLPVERRSAPGMVLRYNLLEPAC
jgi:hypothetical protein